jgi:pyruvate/2-oxoacid:ferredoxin oxidoreductase alpha subunit
MHEDLEFPSEKVNTSMLYLGQGHVEPESYTSNAEEEEAWKAAEERMDIIGQNGATGEHYGEPASKYHVLINGKLTDVYDILVAYGVTNPADAHAIKKMLCPGQRGVKGGIQDRQEAIVSLQRAIELEQGL